MLRSPRWGLARLCAGLFASVHLYSRLGGDLGLAESAGADLAERRPASFVAVGLFGVPLLLVAAAALGQALASRTADRGRRLLRLLGAGVAAVLALRARAVEVLLTGPGYGGGPVSPAQRFWTFVL